MVRRGGYLRLDNKRRANMRSGERASATRHAIQRASVAVIAILVFGGAIALVAGLKPTGNLSTSTAGIVLCCASTQALARAVDANGSLVTNATYRLGQEILLSVAVPSSTSPVSVRQVINGLVYGELGWNVTATKYTYVIDSGPADPADLGVNRGYAVVTFSDGSTARSNNVTWTVTN